MVTDVFTVFGRRDRCPNSTSASAVPRRARSGRPARLGRSLRRARGGPRVSVPAGCRGIGSMRTSVSTAGGQGRTRGGDRVGPARRRSRRADGPGGAPADPRQRRGPAGEGLWCGRPRRSRPRPAPVDLSPRRPVRASAEARGIASHAHTARRFKVRRGL